MFVKLKTIWNKFGNKAQKPIKMALKLNNWSRWWVQGNFFSIWSNMLEFYGWTSLGSNPRKLKSLTTPTPIPLSGHVQGRLNADQLLYLRWSKFNARHNNLVGIDSSSDIRVEFTYARVQEHDLSIKANVL